MRKKTLVVMISVLTMLMLVVAPVGAVTDGMPDGNGHPYVGLMVADVNGVPAWRCSGTLISPTVFLTAGHCTSGATGARVWFHADMTYGNVPFPNYPYGGSGSVEGTPIPHPNYDDNYFVRYDVGVVILDEPVYMSQYGQLPQKDSLDRLARQRGLQNVTFTAVGYGLQESFPDAAAWKENNVRVRMVATPHLLQINVPGFTGSFSMLLSNNAHTGGTCFGDSGGPNFIGKSNVIGGVTSFGINGNCAGTGGVYRMDRAEALNWVASFLP